jgi:hypothetical protein
MTLRPAAAVLCCLVVLRAGAVRAHIKKSWTTLTRSNKDLPAAARRRARRFLSLGLGCSNAAFVQMLTAPAPVPSPPAR